MVSWEPLKKEKVKGEVRGFMGMRFCCAQSLDIKQWLAPWSKRATTGTLSISMLYNSCPFLVGETTGNTLALASTQIFFKKWLHRFITSPPKKVTVDFMCSGDAVSGSAGWRSGATATWHKVGGGWTSGAISSTSCGDTSSPS